MISCILEKSSLFGRDLEQFEEIQNHFGWSEGVTRTKIGTWQGKNHTTEFPTIEEMKQYEKQANKEKVESTDYTQEMISIRNQAIADGTFMKAPNGKPTNLNERQWLTVRTKAFKDWFGDWEKEYTPQTNPYKENPWERYIHTEKTGTYINESGREFPIYANRGVRYAHPVERKIPTKDDPFGFNSFRVNKQLIYVGEEVNEANTLDGICQVTANACKDFLKNRYNIDSSIHVIRANSPVKDAIIDHWVNVVYIDHVAYIYDMPQTEYIKRTKPFIKKGHTYYEGVITSEFKPRLIKVTKENLEKYYGYGETDEQRALITNDTFNKSISLDNITYIPAYSKDVSKVVDENGEPLVVYHGGAKGINIFKAGGSNTGEGYYENAKTGEKIEADSANAVFFSSNPYVAYSYQTLYGINHFHNLYGNVQSMIETTADGKFQFKKGMFSDINNLYNILDELSEYNDRFIKFKEYIKNIKDKYGKISPYLTEKEVTAFRDMLINIRKEIDAHDFEWTMNTSGWFDNFKISRNIINRYNNKEGIHKLLNGEIPSEIKKEWEIYKKIENQREKEGLNKIGNYEELTLWIGTSESFSSGDYRFVYDGTNLLLDNTSLPDDKRMIPITKMSEKEVSDFFNNALIIQKSDIVRRKNVSNFKKVISKGDTYAVFLNIRDPFIHDYEGTHQGQGYKQSQKISFGYIAARQVKKAIQEGNDGVIYENLYDPYLATNYGVFNPNQIKSATDNIEFNRENNNIYKSQEKISNGVQNTTLQAMLGTEIEKEISLNEIIDTFLIGSPYEALIKTYRDDVALKDVKVKLTRDTNGGKYDSGSRRITLGANTFFNNGNPASIMMHEIMHALTVDRINKYPEYKERFKAILDEYRKKNDVFAHQYYYDAHTHKTFDEDTAIKEFIADCWTNPRTIKELDNIVADKKTNRTLWDKIKSLFNDIFKAKEGSLLETAAVGITDLLNETLTSRDFTDHDTYGSQEISQEQQSLEQKLDYFNQELHLLENFGSKNGPMHTIPYREYAKINNVFESFGYVGEKSISSYLYKIYGDNLKGIFDYNKETKELTVNNWVYELINLINQDLEKICNLLEFLYDGIDEVIVKVENSISLDKKIIDNTANQLSQLKTTTNQSTIQETITEQPIDTHQEKEIVDLTPDRQMKQVWNPTVLNSRIIRVTQIFKDIVTKLENQLDDREKLATSAATRQYLITTKYGAKNILDKVREEIQKTYADRNWVENFVHELYDEADWNTQEVKDKIDYIYQQGQYMIQFFEPLMMEASTEIKRLEKVSVLTNDGELTQDDFEEDNTKAEEELSKHEEGWFFENHEQSVESTLSSEVKTILSNLYEKDNEGFQTRFDDLEQPIPLDYRVALGTCLYIVGNCTSDSEMITSLREYANKYPWLQDVVNILMGVDTETSKFYEGLSDEDIELKAFNMRALFWHDMHKIFVNIAEQSKNDNNQVVTEILNKVEGKDALDAEFEDNCYNNKTLFTNEGKPYKMVYKADGTFNKANYDALHKEIAESKLYQNISTGKVTEAEIDLIDRALKAFGVNISKENLTELFAAEDKTKWTNLHSIIFGFYAANQATNQPLQSVIGEEKANVYDAFRQQYDNLSTLFADKAEGRDESSVYVTVDGEPKRLFSRIFPNRIHTLFNRLLNKDNLSERDYKTRLNEKYGHDWWYAAENPDGETPKFTGVLKDLWTSKKDRQKIKIKTLKASQGISYADEIDAQAEETRLNEFEATKSEGYADYSVPTFSDTGESYYATMKYFNVHNAEQRQELITRLTDVVRQEIRRINVVRERAKANKEAFDNGLPMPIKPIACWDIKFKDGKLKESDTDGTNFHFLPALNNNKETFLRKFNELASNPAAQQQLLERAVVYAINEELKTYIDFYNQTQVNQLPNSKHTEKGNKNLVAFINQIISERQANNVPLNSTQLVYLDKVKKQLIEDTMLPETFKQLKQSIKDILISGVTPNERTAYIEASLNNFQQDTTNLNKLEDYLWNYVYANTQIINLTIKDPAFLGTADKVQKRYKMYYSPVQTAYTIEYDLKAFRETGELIEIDEKLAKKTEYSLVLVDDIIDKVYSFDNLKSLVDKKINDGYLTEEQAVEILSNLSNLYAKTKGKEAEINLADAQCYRTLPSWQKCLNMIGKGYNKKMQQSINRLMNPEQYGEWSYEDYHNVWEIFKPFVASDMSSPSGVESLGDQYAEVGMPVMHKNAEFLLLAMYNQLSGVMKNNWKLKALNEFMVKHGIDKVQFESAVKLGNQGAININTCATPEEVISTLEIATGLTGDKQADEGDKQVVHSIPFEDWGISTSMPEHLLDHPESAMGTQLMKIITEGLSENPNKTLKVGNRTMTYAQWLEEYQALQMANLRDDFAEVGKIFTNNVELVKYLKKQILTQNKYSHELLYHLELDENGNFKYPLIDPMLRSQFDALCSSLIRNNVTKRKRRMGALPQVASFGFEEDLQIRCADSNGNLLLTKKEFEEQGSNIQGIETWEAYKEYSDNNATNIAYMEVYMPPFDTTLMRKINDACIYKENVYNESGKLIHRSGEFNHQLFNKIFAKDLLNGLANRVPTETKHSMIPIYVKGFLPAQNSSCVVVPAEWIAISDSDNDGDKLYCYFYHSKAVWNISKMKKDWAEHYGWNYLSKAKREDMLMNSSKLTDDYKKSEELDAMWEAPSKFADKALEEFKRQAFTMYNRYCKIEPVEFKVKDVERFEGESDISYQHRCEIASIASNSFEARNNRMLDLERAVLQTDENSVQMLIPGGFPIIKKVVNEVIKPLYNATKDVMSICNPATRTIQQIRNMAGANLIGIYANHRSFRPLLERAKCVLHANNQPTINGNISLPNENGVPTWSLSASTNARGEFISDNISNFSGASVDNAKDPLLSWLGQNTITAPLTMFLIHCGYTIEEVALFMNQPSIKKAVRESFITGEPLEKIVERDYKALVSSSGNITNTAASQLYNDTMKDQIRRETEGILPTADDNYIQSKVLENLIVIMPASRALQNLINVTKADTQVGALQAKSSENKSKLMMYDRVITNVTDDSYPIIGAEALVPEINTFEDINTSSIPLTATFRYLGVESITDFTRDISMTFTKLVDRVLTIAMQNYNGLTLNADSVEALTHATTSYIFSSIAALNKGDRLKRFNMALSILRDVKNTKFGKENILIKDLLVNLNGNKYSKNMPYIKLKRLNNNYTATESYRRAWEDLIVNSDKTIQLKDRTITYGQLSNLLFNYCFMVSGLTKRGNSFINCFPPAYIDRIEGYNELLQTIADRDISDEIATNIFEQYIANHPEDSRFVTRMSDVQKFLDKSKVIPNTIIIKNLQGNEDWYTTEYVGKGVDMPVPYKFITFTDKLGRRYLYKGVPTKDGEGITYQRVSVLGNSRNGYLEEYENGKNIDFDLGVKSIIAANRNLYTDAKIQTVLVKEAQEAAIHGHELSITDMKQIFKRMLGNDSGIRIDLIKYSPSEEDATGMKFCAII